MNFPPVKPGSSEIKVDIFPTREAGVEAKILELSQILFAESTKAEKTEKQPQKETRTNGFEPFVDPETQENQLFINGYNGNFAQKMDLNRQGIEKVLKIAHLEGQVFLTTLSPNRQKSIEANPDGSVSAKRFLLYEEKAGEDEKDSPLSRVVAVPQGWRIEINDARLTEELTERKLGGQELQRAFIKRFDAQLKQGLLKSIWREKCSSEKDKYFKSKRFFSLLPVIEQALTAVFLSTHPFSGTYIAVGYTIASYAFFNWLGELFKARTRSIENLLKELGPSFSPRRFTLFRQIDSFWEYFMPLVEIDKVARAFVYLSPIGKGRTLVKEKKTEVK